MRRSLTALALVAGMAAGCGHETGPTVVKNIFNVPVYIGDNAGGGNPYFHYDDPEYLNAGDIDPHIKGSINPGETAVASCLVPDTFFKSGIGTIVYVRNDRGEEGYANVYSDGTDGGGPVQQMKPDVNELEEKLPRC
jgi:hypothetical protein